MSSPETSAFISLEDVTASRPEIDTLDTAADARVESGSKKIKSLPIFHKSLIYVARG